MLRALYARQLTLPKVSHFSRFNYHAQQPHTSFWSEIQTGPKDPVLGIQEIYLEDKNPQKINLGVGAYRTDEGKSWILPSIAKAQLNILSDDKYNHEYLPIHGNANLCKLSQKLMYGENASDLSHMVSMQALSGTGSLRMLMGFIHEQWLEKYDALPTVHVPIQTWMNHFQIAHHSGLKVESYPYFDYKTKKLDMIGMCAYMKNLPKNSVVVLHAVAHNPTGVDPSEEQWKELCAVIKTTGALVLFDNAYQGFASGNIDQDAFACRLFRENGVQTMLAQSFAKNMGLYGQRVGVVSIDCVSDEEAKRVLSQLKMIARGMYSNPPAFGARVAEEVLGNADIRCQWLKDIKTMSERIISMRHALKSELEALGSSVDWQHITDQIGMFCFTGVNAEQCEELITKHSLYLTRDGRISIAGLNSGNVKQVAEKFHAVTK